MLLRFSFTHSNSQPKRLKKSTQALLHFIIANLDTHRDFRCRRHDYRRHDDFDIAMPSNFDMLRLLFRFMLQYQGTQHLYIALIVCFPPERRYIIADTDIWDSPARQPSKWNVATARSFLETVVEMPSVAPRVKAWKTATRYWYFEGLRVLLMAIIEEVTRYNIRTR